MIYFLKKKSYSSHMQSLYIPLKLACAYQYLKKQSHITIT